MPLKGAEIGFGTLAASFVLACGTVYQWIQRVDHYSAGHEGRSARWPPSGGRSSPPKLLVKRRAGHEVASFVPPVIRQWTWWQVSDFKFTLGIQVDGLSVSVMFVVTLIAMLIQLYSIEYVKGDRRFTFFFSALTLFAAGMLCMVVAESTVQFILGWEIMGLCSFLLIGHWWEDYANARAALKAFFTVRVGDIGILVGMSVLFFSVNSWAQENLGSDGFSIFAISGWALSGDASRTVLLWARWRSSSLRSASPASSAAHLAPRRHGRPDPRVGAAALLDDGRGRRLPGGAPLSRVLRGLPGSARPTST